MSARKWLQVVVCGLTLAPSVAMAAGDGGPAEIPWVIIAGSVFNVAVLLFLIKKFGWPKVEDSLKARKANLEQEMSEARALKQEAEAELERIREKTANLDAEREHILTEYRELGEAEKTRIIEEAEAQARRIRQEAKRAIDHELEASRRQLKKEVLEAALEKAEGALRERVDKKRHNALVDQTIAELGNL